jgi:plasmid maintenance system antidote protein VapI
MSSGLSCRYWPSSFAPDQPAARRSGRRAPALRVPAVRIGAVIREREPRAVTAGTTLRLAPYFGTTARFWRNPQAAHDMSGAELMDHEEGHAMN